MICEIIDAMCLAIKYRIMSIAQQRMKIKRPPIWRSLCEQNINSYLIRFVIADVLPQIADLPEVECSHPILWSDIFRANLPFDIITRNSGHTTKEYCFVSEKELYYIGDMHMSKYDVA